MKSRNIGYVEALDHLRGLAAMLIVFYHGFHLLGQEFRYGKFVFGRWFTLRTTKRSSSPFPMCPVASATSSSQIHGWKRATTPVTKTA